MIEPIITLLTDFGEKDPYVGIMKGVILSICPNAKMIDLSHEIEQHNIRDGAFFLKSVTNYYPKGAIHLVVVDPGVGSERGALIIKTKKFYFVGPDNGILSLAAKIDGIEKVVKIKNTTYFLKPISNTFHGRDIFAPVAGHLAQNEPIENFGTEIKDWIQLEIPSITKNEMIQAEIIHIDRFGNVITNIPRTFLTDFVGKELEIKIEKKIHTIPFCTTYSQVQVGNILGIIGSSDYLEISINQGNAAERLGVQVEDQIDIRLIVS